MNYKSQLKGWAVDRVIEFWKASPGGEFKGDFDKPESVVHVTPVRDLSELKKQADDLAAYAYVPREDLESTAKDLFELVRNAGPGESSIDAMIGTLEHIKNDRISQGIDKTEETAQ